MGNRSYLYLCTPKQAKIGEGRSFAEANNNFPTLWQLLLADGNSGAAITDQRVFGDAGTDNLISDSASALERIARLADAIAQHPLLHTQPALTMQFEALQAYLLEEIAAVSDANDPGVCFSASLDELAWLDAEDNAESFIQRMRADCNQRWAKVKQAIDQSDYPGLDQALGLKEYDGDFSDWSLWAWTFGFSGLDHAYFQQQEEPRSIAFVKFKPEQDDAPWLGDGLERFIVGDLVGAYHREYSDDHTVVAERIVVAAEWHRIERCEHPNMQFLRVYHNDKVGLLRIADGSVRLLHPCTLDEIWDYEENSSQHILAAQQNGCIGLLDENGEWILAPHAAQPCIDELWSFENGYAVARSGELQGAIDSQGNWVIAPEFTDLGSFNAAGYSVATCNSKSCIVRVSHGPVSDQQYDAAHWDETLNAFVITQDKRIGWCRADGTAWISAEWDAIEPTPGDRLRVERDKRVGLLDRDSRICVAPDYHNLQMRFSIDESEGSEWSHIFIAKRDKKSGVIDRDGNILVPFEYTKIDNFSAMSEDGELPRTPMSWLKVMRANGKQRLFGAWDLQAGRETVACTHSLIYAINLYRNHNTNSHGFLIVHKATEKQHPADDESIHVGILGLDGKELHAPRYAWVAERYSALETTGAIIIAQKLSRAWSKDEPVQAALTDKNEYCWLKRDGSQLSHADAMYGRFNDGDFKAAWELACHYRDGEGIEQDQALCKRWTLLAAGQPESALPENTTGNWLGSIFKRASSAWMPQAPDPRGEVDAIHALCMELIAEGSSKNDHVAARAWAEHGLQHRGRDSKTLHTLLGYLLTSGIGGAEDPVRAIGLYERAAVMGDGAAHYNLGVAYEHGNAVAVDHPKALMHYREAAKSGDSDADYCIGMLLTKHAKNETETTRKALFKEAGYHFQRAAKNTEHTIALTASAELSLIWWRGDSGHQDQKSAVRNLLEGAEQGDTTCMDYLIEHIFGNSESPRHDTEQAESWRKRRAEV
jgi:uncharacterized protein